MLNELTKKRLLLVLIFILAIVLRFLYFPSNTYFGFDQARDAYAVKEIISGDFKIVGPPTANGILNHGVLYYYIFTPFYFFSGGDPAVVSLFLRILNASGIFLLFLIVYPLFGITAAFISAFLFAISYEQTQFSLFLNHPSLAVISVLLFYLGLSHWIFRQKEWGLYLAFFGLGLSIQFEFVETQLIPVFILFILIFRKSLPKITIGKLVIGLSALLLPLSSYFISEATHNFFILRQIPNLVFNQSGASVASKLTNFFFIINRHLNDNLIANYIGTIILGIIFFILLIIFLKKSLFKKQLIFVTLWFAGGLLVYLFTDNDAYFYNTGTSIALLVFVGFLLQQLLLKKKLLAFTILILIIISNLFLITKNNPLGPNQKINPQIGLTLTDEQKVVDYIYQNADGQEFAVNALTMPYNVNTTWSYLFEWYGKNKYGYVPVWGGDAAVGFPGGLKVETARSKLPEKRFLIIEPWENVIPSYLVDVFIKSEESYAVTLEKKWIDAIQVWVQRAR